jgi:hypothetical protein
MLYVTPAIVVTCAVPSHTPKQLTGVCAVTVIIGEFGVDKLIVVVPVQLLPSVAVIVYVIPAHNVVKLPLLGCNGPIGNIV